ncbi:hypothetical protein M7I_5042 [Glarea lozoyensis 74030]|uniref:Secreted protein n=1 Tax=Glarea lozoyensis (strain ATCC 74030 / MF5533) TaxID=1104152 RepID=H0EQT5_GLAL7|nr:hypothetical protein M7I_5042 [Glarea lozoyensis 74030]
MKTTTILLPLALTLPSIWAWEFEVGSSYYYGSSNKGCTAKNMPEGTFWRWDRDPSEDCCLRLLLALLPPLKHNALPLPKPLGPPSNPTQTPILQALPKRRRSSHPIHNLHPPLP